MSILYSIQLFSFSHFKMSKLVSKIYTLPTPTTLLRITHLSHPSLLPSTPTSSIHHPTLPLHAYTTLPYIILLTPPSPHLPYTSRPPPIHLLSTSHLRIGILYSVYCTRQTPHTSLSLTASHTLSHIPPPLPPSPTYCTGPGHLLSCQGLIQSRC